MISSVREWYRPQSLEDTISVMKKGRVIPYAGGTSFHRRGRQNITGLVDLRGVNLDYQQETAEGTQLGAMLRFRQLVASSWQDGRIILKQATAQAASQSLRNLITLGGSLTFRPAWSNIPTALLVLDARIELYGSQAGSYPIAEFLKTRLLDGSSLITQVIIPAAPGKGFYRRYSRTHFDYALLDLAVYAEIKDNRFDLLRIAAGNMYPVARRLVGMEKVLTGLPVDSDQIAEKIKLFKPDSGSSPYTSVAFRENLCKTLLQDIFNTFRKA
jgi:CO/xanthine dehydrogenase FAD-binding subunit